MEINDANFEENFDEFFFDVRRHKPKPGQVMAKFTAVAQFVDSEPKKNIIQLLKIDKAFQAVQVMKKIHGAKEPDCYRICRAIAEDLLNMPEEEVLKKPYEFVVEYLFYTQKEMVPLNKHWSLVSLMKYDRENKTYVSDITL
jgi:hypothetical protein